MAKEFKKELHEETKKLIPTVTASEKPIAQEVLGQIPGNYLVMHKESGVYQSVTPNTYRRAYQNNPDYELKKSPNQ